MKPDVETLIIGAGISGIGAGIELQRRGYASFALLEAARQLGGTWRDNIYPGVAVDLPSVSYCFSFETDYPWSREYASGDEIQRYLIHCADKYGVTSHIRYGARAVRCEFDGASDTWTTHLDDATVVTSRFVIAATGLFSQPVVPAIPGLETFAGKAMHTARWDGNYDLTLKRVAVIGTGASAVQVVPEIAPQVAHLSVFQRTPTWVGPRMDRPLSPNSRWSPRRFAGMRRLMRLISESSLEFLTFSIVNYRRFPFVVRLIQRGVHARMRRLLNDPATADALVPRYGLGCKRPVISNRYLQAFNRENVSLVTQPIERICAEGIVTTDHNLHAVDAIILATGFLTSEQGNAPGVEVVGTDGVELGQFWSEHRRQAYAGVSVPGFPNFFLSAGPYSGGFNWFAMLAANLAHIMACIDGARARGVTRVEVKRDAHEEYMQHMWQRAEGTVFKDRSCASANSYYLDRHRDPSLGLPHTPWWRAIRGRWKGTQGYRFGAPEGGRA